MTPNAEAIAARLTRAKRSGAGWIACCPAHEDSTPSLSINDGEKGPVFKCHAGCSQESVVNAIEALGVAIRKPKTNGNGAHEEAQLTLTLDSLAAAKGLSLDALRENHVHATHGGVGFVYANADGERTGTKVRRYLGGGAGGKGFSWAAGSKPSLYGLWRLEQDYANDARIVLCEGETDALTLWQHGYTALALPGASMWREEWLDLIPEGAKVFVIIEPDQGGRTVEAAVEKSALRHRASYIRMPEVTKDPNALHLASDAGFIDDFDKLIASAVPAVQPRHHALDWATLSLAPPPARVWAIDHWLGMGHVTLLAGAGGTGKTSVAQAMGSCLSLGRDYLDSVIAPRRVLMWACEDDAHELHRRQLAIAQKIGVGLAEFEHLFLHSYDGEQVELAGLADGRLVPGPMLAELVEQIGDYKADIVILDNIARLYGGNENDRHQVTSFMALLTGAARPTNAAVLLLGHPGKALGSEYSGSTAWEGAARARLYLGRDLPDKEPGVEEGIDDGVRYLCRRKANYSSRDYRKIQYIDGVMVPDDRPESPRGTAPSGEFVQEIVFRAIRQLASIGKFGNASTASPEYLPKLADQYKLLESASRSTFGATVRKMEVEGKIRMVVVGKYQNRTPKMGYEVVP
jgi:hypothetical protein